MGSLGALLLWVCLSYLSPVAYLIAVIFFCIGAVIISEIYEKHFKTHDASEVVIDEVAGMLVALAFLPFTWQVALVGFLLFRFFDILKPFPIRQLDQKVSGGFGVVIDDLVAGLFVNIILQAVFILWPHVLR